MINRFPLLLATINLLIVMCFTSSSLLANEFGDRLEELSDLQKPEGQGPFPAVVLVPGCSGFKWPFYGRAQSKLLGKGFVTARVDYVAAHKKDGISYRASNNQIAEDILFVVEHLSKMSMVKSSSINVLAWSCGGGGALQVLSKLEQHQEIQVATVATYSPACNLVASWTANVPVLMLLGGADSVTFPAFCRKLVEGSAVDKHVIIEEYANAYHGFDDEDLPSKLQTSFGTMGYHPEAAKKAWGALTNFLIQ